MVSLTRRRFGQFGLAAAATLAAPAYIRRSIAAGDVRMLTWKGMGSDFPDAVEKFRAETGIGVVHDYFTSELEMLTKLRTNPGAYDVALVNFVFVDQAAKQKLIEPLDVSKLTQFQYLQPKLRDSKYTKNGDTYWGVAWTWGSTGIISNTTKIKPTPDSIQALWDPAHAGRVTFRDDPVEAVSWAAIATGQDMNFPADLKLVKEKLLALKPQIQTFWKSSGECEQMFAAETVDISPMWSGSAGRMRKRDIPVDYFAPKEGGIGWFDTLAVAAGTSNQEGALKFIDYLQSPEFFIGWDERGGAPAPANLETQKQLPDDSFNKTVLGDPKHFESLIFMEDLGDEKRQEYLDLWEDVKATFG